MPLRTIEVALRANTAAFSAQMGTAAASVRGFGNQVETVAARNSAHLQALGKVGMAMGAAVLAGAGLSVAAAIKYESAFAGVAKTVDGTAQQMAQLSDGIRGMARELPASTTEIAAVAEAAGALGVKREDILGFTRVMIDLGETTNLSADQAATSLAQMSNIMGTAGADIDRLGSTLVHLGNNGASTEAEILELAQRLAGAGNQAGLSEADVLGFANALASMGINAEAGGTAFSRVFVKINDAVIDGGEKLDVFAGLAGMSAEKFRAAYEQDAAGAITMFIGGLGRMMDSGQSTTAVLEDLELGEIRVSDALRRTAGNTDVLTNSLQQGQQAWDENSALTEEAEKRYKTTGAQLEILRNNVVDLAIGFGDRLLPAVRFMADGTKSLLQGFQDMPGPMQGVVAVTGSVIGVLAGAAGTALVFGDRIRGGIEAMRAFGDAFPRLSGQITLWGGVLGAAGVGIGLLASAMGKAKSEADKLVASLTQNLDRSSYDDIAAGLDRIRIEAALVEEQLPRGFDMVGASLLSFIEVLTPLENTVLDNEAAFRALLDAEDELAVTQVKVSENTGQLMNDLSLTREEVERLAQKAGVDLSGAYHEVVPALKAAHDEMTTGLSASEKTYLSLEEQEAAAKVLKETYEELTEALAGFVDPMSAYETALESNKERAEEWAEGQNKALESTKVTWKDYMVTTEDGTRVSAAYWKDGRVRQEAEAWAKAQNDSLDSVQKSWEDFPEGVAVSMRDYADELQKQIEAQDKWATNLMVIAGRGRGDVARELAKMGVEGSALVAEFAGASEFEMNRTGDLLVESAKRGAEDVGQTLDTEFKIVAEIAKQGANGTVQSVAEALADLPGVSEESVREAARKANRALDEAKPDWNRRWADRSEAARMEMAGVRRDVPTLAGAAAEESEREVARRGGSWGSRWWERYWGARVPTDAMRRDVPPVVGATGGAMSDFLAGGLPRFQQTVGNYTGSLESGVRKVSVASGWTDPKRWVIGKAEGGIVDFYAQGGLKESHQAQIARAGDWRVWAEPETGGEAYIPLSPSKKGRSVPIWLETGRRLGLDEDSLDYLRDSMQFHDGGIYNPPDPPGFDQWGHPIRPRSHDSMRVLRDQVRLAMQEHMKLPHHQEPAMDMSIGGGAGGGMGWQWQMAVLRQRFPGLPLYSGFRPGAITATGNPSWHGKGRAVDIPPRLDVNKWIAQTYGAGTKELILTAPGATQIKNGRPHVYTGITRAMHKCVPLDVEILTKRGWLTYDQLQEGDETPGLNWETGETEWTPILGVNRYEDAEVVETGSNKWTVRTTPEHKWVARHPKTGECHWVTTGSRQQHPWVVAAPMADGPGVDVTEDEAELLGWLMTDGSQWEGGTPCAFEECANTATAKGLCGSHRRQQRKGKELRPLCRKGAGTQRPGFSLFVWQIKPEGAKRLKDLLGDRASSNGKGYRLRDAYARDLLDRAGLTHIKAPDDLLVLVATMTGTQRQAMLRGVIGGDGTADGRRVLQNDGPLVGVITTLAYFCGKRPRVTKRNMSDDGWKRTGVPMSISLSRPRVSTYRQERRPLGRMPVWCPTTRLGTWTARFDGNPVLTANSHNHWAYELGGILDGFTEQFNGIRSYDSGGFLPPGYTLAHNGTGRNEVIPTPVGASQPALGPSVTIQASYAFNVDGELGSSSRRELHRMMSENNRELARMVRAGTH